MAEDVVDVSVLGGYAALHERERAAASGARFVRRHARWDPAWSGTVIDSSEDDPSASRRRDETRDAAGRDASSRRRAESPDRLQRPPWDGGRSRGRDPGPPLPEVRRRSKSQPRREDARAAPSRDPRCAWSPRDATSTPPSPRARLPPVATPRDRDAAAAVRAHLARPVRLSRLLRDHPTAFDPQKRRISAVDKRLSVIDDVPTTYHRCERLYVSHNRLRSLASLAQFPELRLLSAADNPVDDVTQLDALASACPHLEALSLELTPLAKLPHYRAHVLARLPNLRSLDGVAVSESEARRAPGLVRRDVGSLEMLMSAAAAAAKLRRAYQLSRVHEELRAVVFASCGPVAPSSLPGRDDVAAPLDARRFLRLCAPERRMTRGEVSGLARELRAAAANEAPEVRRAMRLRDGAATTPDETAVWEGAYAAAR